MNVCVLLFYLFIYYLIKIKCMTIYRTIRIHLTRFFLSLHSFRSGLFCVNVYYLYIQTTEQTKNKWNDAIHYFFLIYWSVQCVYCFHSLSSLSKTKNKMSLRCVHSLEFLKCESNSLHLFLCNCLAIAHGNGSGSVMPFNTSLFSGVREHWSAVSSLQKQTITATSKIKIPRVRNSEVHKEHKWTLLWLLLTSSIRPWIHCEIESVNVFQWQWLTQ